MSGVTTIDAQGGPRPLVRRAAEALGWTAGQVWTVAVGLAVAAPAAIFGLGPTLLDAGDAGLTLAAPPATPPAVSSDPAEAGAPPSILGDVGGGPAGSTRTAPATSSAGLPAAGDTGVDRPVVPIAPAGPFATIGGAGSVRAVAVAADAVVVAVDAGPDAPGRVVALDERGEVVADRVLDVDGTVYAQPTGVAVSDRGVYVATAAPAAVLRIEDGTVTKLADLPDLPLCLPLSPATGCQDAVPEQAPRPEHVAVGSDGSVYVADRGQACIFRVGPDGGEVTSWMCDLAFMGSPAVADSGLTGLAVDDDRVVVTVAATLEGTDRVDEVLLGDGEPGARRQLAALPAGAGTSGVALLPDGRVVVALRAQDAVLLVAADGSSSSTVALDDVSGPTDVDVLDGDLVVVHRVDGAAGAVSRTSTPAG